MAVGDLTCRESTGHREPMRAVTHAEILGARGGREGELVGRGAGGGQRRRGERERRGGEERELKGLKDVVA
jgi:hypothetical protein